MANKPQINYYSRDFESIKATLVEYAKRFYPNEYTDFTEASFGSFLLDAISYVGDTLSFQLDYQVNENMLETAINRDNIFKVARQMGWKDPASPSASGFVTVYVEVPGTVGNVGPATDYAPVLKKGATFSSVDGAVYTLVEDVDFSDDKTEYIVTTINETTGVPEYYAARQKTKVISGIQAVIRKDVLDRSSDSGFLEIELEDDNIVEIISVEDLEGNTYYQVDSLTQNLVFKGLLNEGQTSSKSLKVLTPYVAARRFKVDFRDGKTKLIFGNGKEDANSLLASINDPSKVVLQKFAKDYISSTVLDPTIIDTNDQFGIGPSNTQLTIVYRLNTSDLISAGRNQINQVSNFDFTFGLDATDTIVKNRVAGSIEVENDDPINSTLSELTNDEMRMLASGIYSSQNRAVTMSDYEAASYRMPPQFGVVKRVKVVRDLFSPRRSMNLYVLGEDNNGNLANTSQAIKDNLKTWIQQYKSVSDSIDILDGKIISFQIKFTALSNIAFDAIDATIAANGALRDYFNRRKYNFGESINISEISKRINDLEQVDDVLKLTFTVKNGVNYSSVDYNFIANTTTDGRYIKIPDDYVFEIKRYDETIAGETV